MLADWINPKYLKEDVLIGLHNEFRDAQPFSHLVVSDFLIEDVAVEILNELANEEFIEKEADLFQFMQTHDLSGSTSQLLRDFRSFLCSEDFIGLMYKLTNVQLKINVIDLHGSLYQDTDYLLCHDDQLDERRIAFLLYLNDMEDDEGGSLNLFSSEQKLPKEVVKRIIPKFNTFAFFKVSEESYHEVEEIVVEKQRIALGGWLHE